MSKIVIALGGNALGKNPSEQLSLLKDVAKIIVDLVKDGNKIILTHGNGPQVGQIALAMEYASNGEPSWMNAAPKSHGTKVQPKALSIRHTGTTTAVSVVTHSSPMMSSTTS